MCVNEQENVLYSHMHIRLALRVASNWHENYHFSVIFSRYYQLIFGKTRQRMNQHVAFSMLKLCIKKFLTISLQFMYIFTIYQGRT